MVRTVIAMSAVLVAGLPAWAEHVPIDALAPTNGPIETVRTLKVVIRLFAPMEVRSCHF